MCHLPSKEFRFSTQYTGRYWYTQYGVDSHHLLIYKQFKDQKRILTLYSPMANICATYFNGQ
jgi:ATP adenylyltransferase/5',5'''-P-1,P-4-tetraphosphate phosphorylase II